MKISRQWLQKYFEKSLPDAQALAEALTFHAFEIESVEGDILDVKVTPNRGHDCLSHRGIARELSAILNIPTKDDGLRKSIMLEPKTEAIKVRIEDSKLCPRFTGAFIKGIHVGPSPEWLRTALESVGQKSINNVVDATNYVMFDIGQPLHAFDTQKLKIQDTSYKLHIRNARKGEKLMGLDDKEYALSPSMLVIEDANAKEVVSIAGIKGGKPTGIDEMTTDMFLEAANWDGVTIRKTSQALKLRTDASERFQQVISSELAVYGTLAAAKLIVELAGGEAAGYVDEYPQPQKSSQVSVSTTFINDVLGASLSDTNVADVFGRLNLPNVSKSGTFTVQVPFERLDLTIPEDLVEEIGRIVGYDKIPSTELPPMRKKPEINQHFYAAEHTREELVARGYSEVYTSVFADKGEREVLNKVGGEKPYLRTNLGDGLRDALEKNVHNKDLLGLKEVKLFEIGTAWKDGVEMVIVGTVSPASPESVEEHPLTTSDVVNVAGEELEVYENLSVSPTERYQPFSKYPFILRDIALWVPEKTASETVLEVIRSEAGQLLVRSEKFDEFKKEGKTSYAFRLVFQSFEKTLTDAEVNTVMEKINAALADKGWQVR